MSEVDSEALDLRVASEALSGRAGLWPRKLICRNRRTRSPSTGRKNLQEAIVLFFETASPEEIERRWSDEVYVTHVEVVVG